MPDEPRFPDSEGYRLKEYGGAIVNRRFTMGERQLERNTRLTAEEVASIPRANLHSLINRGYLHPFPPATEEAALPKGERFLVRRADLKYDVVQGVRVNPEPLTKAEAEVLL